VSAAAAKRTALAAASIVALLAVTFVPAGGAGSDQRDHDSPATPQNIRVVAATPAGVQVAWDPSVDDVAVAGYYVFGDKGKATVEKPEYTVTQLGCGESTQLTVIAFDGSQNRSDRATATVTGAPCLDTQPPTAPSGFRQVATSENAVVLAWDASRDNVGVVGYGVYRSIERVTTVAEPTATLSGLSCGSTYEYAVDAADASGNRSLRASVFVRTASCPTPTSSGDTTPPSAPSGLAASNTTQSGLALSWKAASDNVAVTGYDVYRNGAKVATVSATSVAQSALSCGTAYAFAVVARDAAGNSSPQGQLTASTSPCSASPSDTTPPSAPSGLAVSNTTQSGLTLSWKAASDNVAVTGYDVYRDGAKVAAVGATSVAQSALSCGTAYAFAVVARDAAGNSSPQAQLSASTSPCSGSAVDTTPPSQPANLAVVSATGASVALGWSASTDNVGVAGYRVYVNGSYRATTTQPGATVSALTCGTAYTFAVDAFDAEGNSSRRAAVTGSTAACADTQAPSAPTNVVASSRTATSIALSWSPSSDDVGVAGYGLYRAGTRVGTSSSTSGIFSGLTCNTSYTLAVDAYDAAGNRSSQAVAMVSTTACPDTTAPASPTGLAASSVTQTGLTLTWNASTDNVGVTGYDVYRDGTKMATVTSTSSAQSGLACGTSHSFGVVARDAAGNASSQALLQVSTTACSASPSSLSGRWFADSSPWNAPIPQSPSVVSQSSSWINALYSAVAEIDINQGAWTPNVFTASQSDPTQTMVNQDGWIVDSVPIPANLTPSSDSDAHAVILAPWTNRAYEFFGLRKDSAGNWTFSAADVIGLGGSGWWDGAYSSGGLEGPWGPRASGGALTGGLIRPAEIQAGTIGHALACAAPKNLIGPPVSPARTSDGSGGSGAMPMGSHLQLDPSLDLSTLGLEPGEEIVARALQTYGAYIVDSSSSLACYAQSTALGGISYPSSWSSGIRRDLVLRMRIVAPPPAPTYDSRATFSQPHR
jgi:chitodextrinase